MAFICGGIFGGFIAAFIVASAFAKEDKMWVDRAVDTFLKYCNPKAKFIPFRLAYWIVWLMIIGIFAPKCLNPIEALKERDGDIK